MPHLDQPFESTDDFYGEDDGAVKYKLRHFGKFKLVVILSCVLAVLCVVFIVLFALEKGKERSVSSPIYSTSVCNSRECTETAYDFLQQLNQSVDPCEDFYQYACGGWIQRNPLKEGETFKNGFTVIQEKNNQILKQAIETSWIDHPKNKAVLKTAKFYNVCIDKVSVEKEGIQPLQQLIKDLGGWHLSGHNVTEPLLSRIAKMNRELHSAPLFKVTVFINPTDSSKHILMFGQASIGMAKEYYVTDSPENLKVREAYKQYMKDIANLLSGKNNSDELMMQVYEFESKLAMAEKQSLQSYSTIEEHMQSFVAAGGSLSHAIPSLEKFGKLSNISLGIITGFLSDVFKDQKFTFAKNDLVLTWPPYYFSRLFQLFANQTKTDPKVLDNYAMWTAINQHIIASPSRFVEARRRFLNAMEGNKTVPRWQTCLTNMQHVLQMPLGFLFVEKSFKEGSKKMVKDMTSYIRQAFLDNIDGYDWMDTHTKQQARAKAKAILEDVGYPDFIKDPVKLANNIKGLQVGTKLFDSVRKMIRFSVKENLDLLNKTVDKDKWLLGPSVVNGYYAPRQNRIVFLAGILQPPFYNPIYPMYVTFGGTGMVIGHEITHGFDNQGRAFDKDGNYKDWWSAESSNNFLERSKCLVNQYSNFEVYGVKIKGKLTMNENIADNGGIKIAYEGYKAWSKANGPEERLPGLGLTVDQLFFVGFAQPWCSIYTKKPALTQINVDSHANAKYRVIGTLQNYPKFAEVFKCKSNTYMNPTKKCKVW